MTSDFKTLFRLIACIAFAASGANAFAGGCKYWNEIKFSDGTMGCLSDYPIAEMRPSLYLGSLEHVMPGYGYTVIAVTSKDAMCPVVVGLGTIAKSNMAAASDSTKAAAAAYAVRNCKSSLENKTKSTGGPCDCEVVITDGTSTLTKASFDAMVIPAKEVQPTVAVVAP